MHHILSLLSTVIKWYNLCCWGWQVSVVKWDHLDSWHEWKCVWLWSKRDLEHLLRGCSMLLCLNTPAVRTFNKPNNYFVHRVCLCKNFLFAIFYLPNKFLHPILFNRGADAGCFFAQNLHRSSPFFWYNNNKNQPAALKDGALRSHRKLVCILDHQNIVFVLHNPIKK